MKSIFITGKTIRREWGLTEIGSSDNDGYWGSYGEPQLCPDGYFVYGYRQKTEPRQGKGDDTALNAVELLCHGARAMTHPVPITGSTQKWGSWSSPAYCQGENNPVTGFQMKIEKRQGDGDDTAANAIDLYCKHGGYIVAYRNTEWGNWRSIVKCPYSEAVMGIKTRVERVLGDGDDTALNGVRLICHKYP